MWVLPPSTTDAVLMNGGLRPTEVKVPVMVSIPAPASVLAEAGLSLLS